MAKRPTKGLLYNPENGRILENFRGNPSAKTGDYIEYENAKNIAERYSRREMEQMFASLVQFHHIPVDSLEKFESVVKANKAKLTVAEALWNEMWELRVPKDKQSKPVELAEGKKIGSPARNETYKLLLGVPNENVVKTPQAYQVWEMLTAHVKPGETFTYLQAREDWSPNWPFKSRGQKGKTIQDPRRQIQYYRRLLIDRGVLAVVK